MQKANISRTMNLVAFEMHKVHAIVQRTIGEFRFASVNLAMNTFALSEPLSCVTKGDN
jgi:hypothetical protein